MSEPININHKRSRLERMRVIRDTNKITSWLAHPVEKFVTYYDSKTGVEANTPDPSIAERKYQGTLSPEDTGEFDVVEQWNVKVDHEGKYRDQ